MCRYCGAARAPDDRHYVRCPVVRLAFDAKYWPFENIKNSHNSGKSKCKSGDGSGWRKIFTRALPVPGAVKRKAKR